jgi:hypothetical protein
MRWTRLAALPAAVVTVWSSCTTVAVARADTPLAQYLGQKVITSAMRFDGTTIGGLSAISYDPQRGVYYVISDDKSHYGAARFYTVRIDLSTSGISDVTFDSSHPLLDRSGEPFDPLNLHANPPVLPPDPEGIAFDSRRQRLYWSSEGEKGTISSRAAVPVLDPWIRISGLDGTFLGEFTLPAGYTMSPTENVGPRPNQSLEGMSLSPDGQSVFASLEDPRYEDGPNPTHDRGALTRVIKFDANTGKPLTQYAYPIDPAGAPVNEGISTSAHSATRHSLSSSAAASRTLSACIAPTSVPQPISRGSIPL